MYDVSNSVITDTGYFSYWNQYVKNTAYSSYAAGLIPVTGSHARATFLLLFSSQSTVDSQVRSRNS